MNTFIDVCYKFRLICAIFDKIMNKSIRNSKKDSSKQSSNACQFIVKILQMMKNYPDVVFWVNDGKSVKFRNIKKLENQVIPEYFRHRNILSFIRQLNMYYFSKIQSEEKDEMVFDHKIFREGNEENFHLIQRRNKFRDEILDGMEKNYSQTLTIIENQPRLRQETKSMLRSAIQYQQIALKNLKKIKTYIDDLSEQLKGVRGKQVKKAIDTLQNSSVPILNSLITEGKALQTLIKQQLCRDLGTLGNINIPPIPSQNYMILLDDPRTIKEIPGMDKAFNMPSDNSLIGGRSECSLGQNLKEQNQDEEEVSFERQLPNNI